MQTTITKVNDELIEQLFELVESGWSEAQIISFARKRASYNSADPAFCATPFTHLTATERKNLQFTRWLYYTGRLTS